MHPVVALANVSRRYERTDLPAVAGLSFEVSCGEVLALLGPSGCGKSTTLRLIAGLEMPDEGEIWLNGVCVAGGSRAVPPEQRRLGMVFQDYALFPHMTVMENVLFGLHLLSPKERRRSADEALDLVGMHSLADRYPHQLSGGQQQRVALARALAPRPLLVLLDEPFSNLDAALRSQVRDELRAILARASATAVVVTHDQSEALAIGDRVALMCAGRLEQIGTPSDLFQQPRNRFVATFMGQADFLSAYVTHQGLLTEIGLIPQEVDLPEGARVDVLVRHDDLVMTADAASEAQIVARAYEGSTYMYTVALSSGQRVHCRVSHTQQLPIGARVRVGLLNDHPLICFVGTQALPSWPLAAYVEVG